MVRNLKVGPLESAQPLVRLCNRNDPIGNIIFVSHFVPPLMGGRLLMFHCRVKRMRNRSLQSFTVFSRSALAMTLTELSAIAAAAIIGESSQPVSG